MDSKGGCSDQSFGGTVEERDDKREAMTHSLLDSYSA